MCNFISAIVMQNGEIVCDPEHTDSHEDLMRARGIRDTACQVDRFCRIEFIPGSVITDPWELNVDEPSTPDWFDARKVMRKMQDRVDRMIIKDDSRPFLLGGCWILCNSAYVSAVKSARIYRMGDSSRVNRMGDSSRVDHMHDSSRVNRMYGAARVDRMHDSSRVDYMHGSSRVNYMGDSSRVDHMHDSSRVDRMHDSSRVDHMHGSSKIENDCR